MLITLVSFFLLLIILILAHELGHFFTAKLCKVRVVEFGIFLPPRIISFKKGETVYSLNALPLGGFNKLAGEEDPDALTPKGEHEETRATGDRIEKQNKLGNFLRSILWLPASGMADDSPKKTGQFFNPFDPRIWEKTNHLASTEQVASTSQDQSERRRQRESGTLAGKSIPVRLLVLSAGSLMNIILPLILLSIALMIPHWESVNNIMTDKGEVFVLEVVANSPAAKVGIKVNDIILTADGEPIQNVGDYERIVKANLGEEITVNIKHPDSRTVEVKLTPQVDAPATQGATGIAITTVVRKSYPFWEAIPNGAISYWNMILLFKDGIVGMIKGTVPVNVTGPVGLAQMTGEIVKTGMANLLMFAAVISLNLGILNIFPIPAMDGGRIVFVLLEWVRRGKRVSPKTEGMIHTIGFILLMIVFLVIAYKDILRLASGKGFGI